MASDFDLDPVDALVAGAIGPPGQRAFFLQARMSASVVTLAIEKIQLQALVQKLDEVLESLDLTAAEPLPAEALEREPIWRVGQLGLAYDTHRKLILVIAQEIPSEEGVQDTGAIARFWTPVPLAAAFARAASDLLAGGRPPCPLCGLPMDARGHVCPKKNGSRPVS